VLTSRQIKEIISNNSLCINKRLGQNFLIDKHMRDRIIDLCNISKDDAVIEIGPGLGALTESIQPLAGRFIAIEKDRGLASILNEKDFSILNKDILKFDLDSFIKDCNRKIKIIGNLPYYITSPIIFYLLEYRNHIESIFITIQREVAKRIVAGPGDKDYGILSLSLQYHSYPEILLSIPKNAFFPRPDVDSVFMQLKIRNKPPVVVKNKDLLFGVIKSAFNQRRKILLNALSGNSALYISKDKLRQVFDKVGLDLNIRGEALSLEDFAKLTDCLYSLQ